MPNSNHFDHYPGAMETLYVTNTPVVFQLVWRIIKPMLPAEVLGRVHLCGGAKEFLPKMIGAGCPLSSIPSWMAVPKYDEEYMKQRENLYREPGDLEPLYQSGSAATKVRIVDIRALPWKKRRPLPHEDDA